jgi:hypothetical protein
MENLSAQTGPSILASQGVSDYFFFATFLAFFFAGINLTSDRVLGFTARL